MFLLFVTIIIVLTEQTDENDTSLHAWLMVHLSDIVPSCCLPYTDPEVWQRLSFLDQTLVKAPLISFSRGPVLQHVLKSQILPRILISQFNQNLPTLVSGQLPYQITLHICWVPHPPSSCRWCLTTFGWNDVARIPWYFLLAIFHPLTHSVPWL